MILAGVFLLALPVASIFLQVRREAMPFQIATPTFSAGETIPKKFTCDGPDVSLQLSWKEAPVGAQSFALIMDDPDAPVGTWVHWVLYNVPANITELPEGVEKQGQLAQRRAARTQRFSQDRIWRPMSSPGKPREVIERADPEHAPEPLAGDFRYRAVTFLVPPESVHQMIQRADEIMYSVKQSGKNNLRQEELAA